jgi:hypothetical protein
MAQIGVTHPAQSKRSLFSRPLIDVPKELPWRDPLTDDEEQIESELVRFLVIPPSALFSIANMEFTKRMLKLQGNENDDTSRGPTEMNTQ